MSVQPVYSYERSSGSGNNNRSGGRYGIILIVIIALFMSGLPQKLYYEYKAYQHRKINNYLDMKRDYTLFSAEEVFPVLTSSDANIEKSLINELLAKHTEHKMNLKILEPPRNFRKYDELLNEYINTQELVLEELFNVREGNVETYNLIIHRSNVQLLELTNELKLALTKSDIPFEEKENGLIEYEIILSDFSDKEKHQEKRQLFRERWDKIEDYKD